MPIAHVLLFALGTWLCYRAFRGNSRTLGVGLWCFAVAQATYLSAFLGLTIFLAAHFLAVMLNAVGFMVIAGASLRKSLVEFKLW